MSADVFPVIDADVHIHESYTELATYFEMPWRRALEGAGPLRETQRDAPGERFLDTPGSSPRTRYDPILSDFPEGQPHQITSPDVLRADLDRRGIDAAVVFTGRLLEAATSNDEHYAAALGRAFNRYLAQQWVNPARGIYAAIMAVNQAPEEAAREIAQYAGRDDFVAVYLPLAGNYPLWGDRMYEPVFAAAQEAGLPVVLQGALTVHSVFPYEFHHLPTALAKHALSQPFGALANLVHLLTTGTLARFPRLQVIVNDAGASWLPFVLDRLDHFYPFLRDEAPFLEPLPGDHARRQVYLTTHPVGAPTNPAFLLACYDAIGIDHVLFGSDWPHFDADAPAQILALPLSSAAKRRVLGETAQELFRLRLTSRVG